MLGSYCEIITTWAVEGVAQLVTDQLVDRLHIQPSRQPLLHALDQRQLIRALLAALRIVFCGSLPIALRGSFFGLRLEIMDGVLVFWGHADGFRGNSIKLL